MKTLTVNEAITNCESLFGTEVFLEGVLSNTGENVLILHWPKSERPQNGYNQVWVHTGKGAFGFNQEVLSQINNKRVVIKGKLQPNQTMWADDPGSYWAVHLLATELTEHKKWILKHGDI